MRENRQVWVEANEVRGSGLRPGNVTTLIEASDDFALRRWDGGKALPAGSPVTVIETRPYGSLLVAEMSQKDAAATLRAIEAIRGDVRRMQASPATAEAYEDELRRLTVLTDRFPEPEVTT